MGVVVALLSVINIAGITATAINNINKKRANIKR
jgi:hypothetical protein